MSSSNVPVQIETCALPPNSELNPLHFPVNGVCGECTRCGRRAEANPADEHGGPVTKRKAAIKTLLAKLTAACPHPLPWGLAPKHDDRRIPRGVTVWCEEFSTKKLLPCAINDQGELEGAWGGVDFDAPVWVIPDTDATTGDAVDLAQRLAPKPAPKRKAKPEAAGKPKRKARAPRRPKGYTDVRVGKAGTAPQKSPEPQPEVTP